jgi:hypothetical protein
VGAILLYSLTKACSYEENQDSELFCEDYVSSRTIGFQDLSIVP